MINFIDYIFLIEGFRETVLEKLAECSGLPEEVIDSNNKNINIKIDGLLWKKFLQTEITGTGCKRKKFKTTFDDFISSELQKAGVLCWLRHEYNWFNKKEFWRGRFKCINKSCSIVYNCVIKKNSNFGVLMNVNWKHCESDHLLLQKEKRCCGTKRNNLALKLMAHGNSNIRQDNLLQNLINENSKYFK